jgi:hypothetical protein
MHVDALIVFLYSLVQFVFSISSLCIDFTPYTLNKPSSEGTRSNCSSLYSVLVLSYDEIPN